ncbi:MAG: DUF2141 domain-containing protein [Novosphingobium sp.]|nr:DUF2141 domain-containing protein [Novosphingobium sp.]
MKRLATAMTAAAALIPVAALAGDAGKLGVNVTGLHSTRGKLVACLWRDNKGFPSCEKSTTARRMVVPVNATTMQIAFPEVVPGTYAVTIHHDEDGNGKMQHNFIGMPKEGVGVSNNPGGMPGFTKSLVTVTDGSAITIRMRYVFD